MAIVRTAKGTAIQKNNDAIVSGVALVNGSSIIVLAHSGGSVAGHNTCTWNGIPLTLDIRVGTLATTRGEIWSLHGVTAATGDVVLSNATNSSKAIAVIQVEGLEPVSPLDVTAGDTGSGTAPSSGATTTTTRADEFLVGLAGTNGPVGDNVGTWSNSFSAGQRNGTTGGGPTTNSTVSEGYRVVSATDSYIAAKLGLTSRAWQAAIATYKALLPGTFVPTTANLSLASHIPIVGVSDHVVVVPGPASFILSRYVPVIELLVADFNPVTKDIDTYSVVSVNTGDCDLAFNTATNALAGTISENIDLVL